MSNQHCTKCRSASDGNLADVEDDSFENQAEMLFPKNQNHECEINKQVHFTLPRWISGRRKRKDRIKNARVDVPFNAKSETKDFEQPSKNPSEEKKKSENPIGLFSRIFRKSFTRPPLVVGANSVPPYDFKRKPSGRTQYLISTSNTDIRGQIVLCDSVDCQEYFKDKTPAVCGIKNHGNTCFMNAVVQCLSNTDYFAEYFVMDQYKVDFLRRNKIHAKKYGTRGEVSEQLAILLKSLWSCQYYPDISQKFKQLVAKYGSQYEGSNQHDAQEFLLWLLDKVHEDLNTASKQKYKKPKSSYGRTDEELAAETLANHLRCNNSFVHDLFQGQFRSSLSCPGCGQYSNTFDPYLCVSLPVPHRQTTSIIVNLILLDEDVKMLKVVVIIDSQATVKDLRQKISLNYVVPSKQIILTELVSGEFRRTFSDTDLICSLEDVDEVYAVETPVIKSNDQGEYMVLLVVSKVVKEDSKNEVFWRPFLVHVPREATYKQIQKQILNAMTGVIKKGVDVGDELLFQLRVIDGVPEHELLPDSVDLPLYMPVVDQALTLCDTCYNRGPSHLKLAAEWPEAVKEKFIIDKAFVEEDVNVSKLKNTEKKVPTASLYECFDLYFTEEKLGQEDAWMCPFCHRRIQGVKQLSLWSVPDIFIVHLKRFRQSFCQRTKVTTLVEFPFSGLDMNSYIANRSSDLNRNANGNIGQLALWSPWKRSRSRPLYSRCDDNLYDLYAVCNHHGSMQGGHYTACCKNPVDGHWYLFDDDKVKSVKDSDIMTADAYILFYQRSTLTSHSCASSSTSGYSTASSVSLMASEHWAFRMPPFLHVTPKTSKSQDNLYDTASMTLDRRLNSDNRPFIRTAKTYSSLIHFNDVRKGTLDVAKSVDRNSDGEIDADCVPPPPPPPIKRYWTITSV